MLFLDWMIHYPRDINSPKLIYSFHATPIKIPIEVFMKLEKLILKLL